MDMALGGSTNTTLHIPAIAHAAEVDVTLDDFDRLSRQTPQLTSLRPGGEHMMEDLEWAGGIPAVMVNLAGLLNADCLNVSGQTRRPDHRVHARPATPRHPHAGGPGGDTRAASPC